MRADVLALGAALVVAGLAVLRFQHWIGSLVASGNRATSDPRHSLLNRERAERIRDAEGDEDAGRLYAIFTGVALLGAGGYTLLQGFGVV